MYTNTTVDEILHFFHGLYSHPAKRAPEFSPGHSVQYLLCFGSYLILRLYI